jgi:two-component system aerobic respiration control protein ArcA
MSLKRPPFQSNGKSLQHRVADVKRKKMASESVVNLAEFRELKEIEPPTILVVDDDEIIRNALKRILEKQGYRVVSVEDGMALSKVLEKTKMDLILLDVNLPWVDGYELCRILKSHEGLKRIPLIFISGNTEKADIEKGFAAGCDNYLTKPFDIDHLSKTIDAALAPALQQSF